MPADPPWLSLGAFALMKSSKRAGFPHFVRDKLKKSQTLEAESSEAAVTFPIDEPGCAQGVAQQNIRMESRLFVLDAKGIGVFCSYYTTIEQPLPFLQIEACEDHCVWQAGIVSAIPERIGQAHHVRQAQGRAVEVQSARFSIIPGENTGALALLRRERVINSSHGMGKV